MRKRKILITQEVITQQINNITNYVCNIIPNMNHIEFQSSQCSLKQKNKQQQGIKFNILYLLHNMYYPIFSFVYIFNNTYLHYLSDNEMLNRIVLVFYTFFNDLDEDEQIFVLNHINLIKDKNNMHALKQMQLHCKGKAINKIQSLLLLYDLVES